MNKQHNAHIAKPAPADSPERQSEHTPRSQGKSYPTTLGERVREHLSHGSTSQVKYVVFVYSDGDTHTATPELMTTKYDINDPAVGIILKDALDEKEAVSTLAIIPDADNQLVQYVLINTAFNKEEFNIRQSVPEYNPGGVIPLLIAQTYVEKKLFSHQDKTIIPPEDQSAELMALPDKATGVLLATVVKKFDDSGNIRKVVFDDYPDRAALVNWAGRPTVGCIMEIDVDNSKVLSVSYPGHASEPAIVGRAARKGDTLLG